MGSFNVTGKILSEVHTYVRIGGERKMAVKRDSGTPQDDNGQWHPPGQLSRSDLLLAAIPLAFMIPLLCHLLLSIPFHVAVGTGALSGAGFVADGLFVNPPTNPPQGRSG
jgi:hypothetical protein